MKNRINITSAHQARLSRRDFGKLTVAAFGGVLLGSTLGGRAADPEEKAAPATEDKHVCRGLNTCKGKGKGGKNSCAGQGNCATVDAHSCKGENACKGQGGDGHAGENSCKGKGSCEVPLKEKNWKKARKAFEAKMKEAGKTVGEAPKE
jgi:hypothetical protein